MNYYQYIYERWITLAPEPLVFDSLHNQCPECVPGMYSEMFPSSSGRGKECICIQCGTGKYMTGAGYLFESSCAPCEIGTFSTGLGATACTSCRSGTFTKVTGRTSAKDCFLCDPGKYSLNFSNCSSCQFGKYSSSVGSSGCQSCQAGTYSSKFGSSSCQICENGRFSSGTEQFECKQCPFGTFSNSNKSFCDICSRGLYALGPGASSCERLSSFEISFGNLCSSCDTVAGRLWSKCSKGTYQSSLSASTGCLQCAEGSAQSSEGETSCILCGPGTYQSSTGAYTCQSCNVGNYQSLSGGTNCLQCGAGLYQSTSAQSKCSVCSPGKYSSGTGSTSDCNVSSAVIIAPPPNPQGEPPTFTSNAVVVTLTMALPYTLDEFTDSVQLAVRYSIAATLNVYPQFVSLNIPNSRRSGMTVNAVAKVPEDQGSSIRSAVANTSSLTAALNSHLQSYGLREVSGISVMVKTEEVLPGDQILSRLTIKAIQDHLLITLGLNATCVTAPSVSSNLQFINVEIRVPLALSDLDKMTENKIIIGISQAAGVDSRQVNITSMSAFQPVRRSLSSTNVFIQIDTLLYLSTSITTSSVSTYSSNASLSTNASFLVVPFVTSGSDSTGKIIGGAVGGSLGFLALLLFAFLACKFTRGRDTKHVNVSQQIRSDVTTREERTYDQDREHQVLSFEKPTTTFV